MLDMSNGVSSHGWDAIVVGGGHNGLAAASVLARSGRSTLVLEARDHAGGLCLGEMFHPGYRHTGLHHDADTVRPWVLEALQLHQHGVALRDRPPLFLPAVPGESPGSGLLVHDDPEEARGELLVVSDDAGYKRWRSFVDDARPTVADLLDAPTPRVGRDASAMPLIEQAFRLRRRGAASMLELLRAVVMSADDWLGEFVGHPRLKAGLALGGLNGAFMGPRSPQSAGLVLLREAIAGREIVGGPAKLAESLLAAVRHQGVTVRCSAAVERIRVEQGAVRGVVLRGGESIDAPVVVSGLDPRRTLLDLVAPIALPPLAEDEVRGLRTRATSAKLHLALSHAPVFTCRERQFERIRVVSDTTRIERAFDDAKHGRLPSRPPLDIRVPSVADPTLAPPGHHVLSIHVFGVPYAPAGGWSKAAREQLVDAALAVLGEVAPSSSAAVVAAELLVPPEIEARYGVTGGHPMHGEHALDQLWIGRPGPTLSRHATPIRGLFLGSGGTHPYGGASGAAGVWAARSAMEAT
jgi:phytoene dehydrogenase-like protein